MSRRGLIIAASVLGLAMSGSLLVRAQGTDETPAARAAAATASAVAAALGGGPPAARSPTAAHSLDAGTPEDQAARRAAQIERIRETFRAGDVPEADHGRR